MLRNAGGALLSAGLQLRLLSCVFQDDDNVLQAVERAATDAAQRLLDSCSTRSDTPALAVELGYHRVHAIAAVQRHTHAQIQALLEGFTMQDTAPTPSPPSVLSRRRLRASLTAAAQQRAEEEAAAAAARARSQARMRQRQLDAIVAAQQQRAAARQLDAMYVHGVEGVTTVSSGPKQPLPCNTYMTSFMMFYTHPCCCAHRHAVQLEVDAAEAVAAALECPLPPSHSAHPSMTSMHTPDASPSMRATAGSCLPHALTDSDDDDFVSVQGSERVDVGGSAALGGPPQGQLLNSSEANGAICLSGVVQHTNGGGAVDVTLPTMAVGEQDAEQDAPLPRGSPLELAFPRNPPVAVQGQPPTDLAQLQANVPHNIGTDSHLADNTSSITTDGDASEQQRRAAITASIRAAGKRTDLGSVGLLAPCTPRQSPLLSTALVPPRTSDDGTALHHQCPHARSAIVCHEQPDAITDACGELLMPLPAAIDACVVAPIMQQYHAVSAACMSVMRHRLQLPAHLALLSSVCLGRDCDLLPLLAAEMAVGPPTAVLGQRDVDEALEAAARVSCIATNSLLPRLRLLLKGVVSNTGVLLGGALRVAYDCQWPLTCIIDANALEGYSCVAAMLLAVSAAQHVLNKAWRRCNSLDARGRFCCCRPRFFLGLKKKKHMLCLPPKGALFLQTPCFVFPACVFVSLNTPSLTRTSTQGATRSKRSVCSEQCGFEEKLRMCSARCSRACHGT